MSEASVEFRAVGASSELDEAYVNPYYLEDLKQRVAVARVGGALYAFDDLYENGSLSAARLEGTTIMSQIDGSQFDITSGAVLRGPATEALRTYEVREEDGEIQVRMS